MIHDREAIFAAWLSNMDRFYRKGITHLIGQWEPVLKQCLDIQCLLGILEGKGEYKPWNQLVQYAKALSLCESEQKEKHTTKKNLTSVFSRVTVRDAAGADKQYYSLKTEDVRTSFPLKLVTDHNLDQLADEFEKELLLLGKENLNKEKHNLWKDFTVVFDSLTKKYLWCITASDYEGEDVSLYNQSRIAAAIASCICQKYATIEEWDPEKEEQDFKLVTGDFSGIQKYIFSVANVSEDGVAKRLRARSFYVDVTVSVVAQAIIDRFGLTQNHILMQTGGKFYLLLPNTTDSDACLEQIECEVEKNFYDLFKGQISIHLAWISIGADGLKNYSSSVVNLSRCLADKKSQAFHHSLVTEDGWNENTFIIYSDLAGKTICKSCGCELTDKPRTHCRNCEIQEEIGKNLPRVNYIAYYRNATEMSHPGTYAIYGTYRLGLWPEFRADDAFLVEQLNAEVSIKKTGIMPVRNRYMANHIPIRSNGEVITFNEMAGTAKGIQKLAVLKADVDNLGYIFADGLRTGDRHYGTISRVNTMSRLLETFFSGFINELMKKSEFQNVYSVFSGGDDLFLIGPWDVMPKMAVVIQKEFQRFVAMNPAMTLSATISVFHPKEHIANLAELSEQALKRVKNSTVPRLYPEKEGRNGVSFLGELYSWEDFEEQLEIGRKLAELVQEGSVDIGILRRISRYSSMYRKFLNDGDVMALMFEPLFHYDRQRNYEKLERNRNKSENLVWFLNEYVADLSKNAADSRNTKRNLFFAEATVTYAMSLTKEERNDGK